eukprot:SAG11_NODE_27468_length_332_cov_0.888412_1_plen_30_part_10
METLMATELKSCAATDLATPSWLRITSSAA